MDSISGDRGLSLSLVGYVTSVLSLGGMSILGEYPVSLQRCCRQTGCLPQRLAVVGPRRPQRCAFVSKASEWDTQPEAEFCCYYSFNCINFYSNISFKVHRSTGLRRKFSPPPSPYKHIQNTHANCFMQTFSDIYMLLWKFLPLTVSPLIFIYQFCWFHRGKILNTSDALHVLPVTA